MNRYGVLHGGQTCPLSGKRIVDGPFYTFPSGNTYREDALREFVSAQHGYIRKLFDDLGRAYFRIAQMVEWFQDRKLKEVILYLHDKIQQHQDYLDKATKDRNHMANVNALEKPDQNAVSKLQSQLRRLREKFDMIVACDDPLCGEPMIQSIDEPFGMAPGEVDEFEDMWELE